MENGKLFRTTLKSILFVQKITFHNYIVVSTISIKRHFKSQLVYSFPWFYLNIGL